LVDIGEKLVDGLALALVILIALLLGFGIGALVFWEGPIPEGFVIWPILGIGTILAVTTMICCCLRAWVKEQ
jgi:hypothetical protein